MFKNIPISALIGLIITGTYFLAAIFAPLIAPYGMAEAVGDVWEPSSAEHWLGTDQIGRDLLTRMIYGGRTTIWIATVATIVSFVTGSVLGFLAAGVILGPSGFAITKDVEGLRHFTELGVVLFLFINLST